MYRDRPNAQPAPASPPQQQPGQQPQPAPARSYHVQHDFDGPAELTTTLVHALSTVTGADVTDAGFTLNDFVDPDALDRLFGPKADGTPRGDGHVGFQVWGHEVTVYSSGTIRISPPPYQGPHAGGSHAGGPQAGGPNAGGQQPPR